METLITIVDLLYQFFIVLIFVRILSSWIPELHQYRFMQFVSFCTDPYLNLFRRIIPPLGMIDISPIIAIFCLGFIQSLMIGGIRAIFE